jgi:isopenicillin N synthase-like dioxygenase
LNDMATAAARVGFFYMRNHRISQATFDRIFEATKDFYALPLDAKTEVSITNNDHFQGYVGPMNIGDDPNITASLQEAFQIRRPLAPNDPDLLAGKPLHGEIPWPSAMPSLKPRMMNYFGEMSEFGYEMLGIFEECLDMPRGCLNQFFNKDMHLLRLLYCPPQPPEASGEHIGARAHTDTDAFTFLLQDGNGGLEVRNRDGEWVAVPPIHGTLVVNVGEVVKVWTDGVFSSAVHRVINRSGKRRYSIAFFMYPSYDAVIHPVIKNPDPSNVAPEDLPTSMPRDRAFVYGEFQARNAARILPKKSALAG